MNNVYAFTSSIAGSVAEFVKNLPQNISNLVGRTITIIGNHPAHMQESPVAAGLTFVAVNGAALVVSHKIANYVENKIHETNFGTFATIKSGVKLIAGVGVVGGIAAGTSTLVSLATAYPLTPVALGAIAVAAVVVRYGFKAYQANAEVRARTQAEADQAKLQGEFKGTLREIANKVKQEVDADNRAKADAANATRAEQKKLDDQAAYEAIEQQYNDKIALPNDLPFKEKEKIRSLDLDNILELLSPKKAGEEDKTLVKTDKSPHKDRKALKREEIAKTIADANQLKNQIWEAIVAGAPNLGQLRNALLRDNAIKYNTLIRDYLAIQ